MTRNRKRFFGVLLGLVLMLGLMSGMSVTAYAKTWSGTVNYSDLKEGDYSSAGTIIRNTAGVQLSVRFDNGNTSVNADERYIYSAPQDLIVVWIEHNTYISWIFALKRHM